MDGREVETLKGRPTYFQSRTLVLARVYQRILRRLESGCFYDKADAVRVKDAIRKGLKSNVNGTG